MQVLSQSNIAINCNIYADSKKGYVIQIRVGIKL